MYLSIHTYADTHIYIYIYIYIYSYIYFIHIQRLGFLFFVKRLPAPSKELTTFSGQEVPNLGRSPWRTVECDMEAPH